MTRRGSPTSATVASGPWKRPARHCWKGRSAHLRLGYSLYLVERRSDGAPLGLCGLLKRDFLPGADIGYALAPRYWGHGYAREAASAVLAYARDTLKLPCLLAITHPDNQASISLLEKLGLEFLERKQLPGYDGDSNVYCLAFQALNLLRE
jgi:RimJ/RimL family protein N-acetyltransferase